MGAPKVYDVTNAPEANIHPMFRNDPLKTCFSAQEWELVRGYCEIQATKAEIAAALGVSLSTFDRVMFSTYGVTFEVYFAANRTPGMISLRRAQFQSAVEGNHHMQKHLGRHWLGQKDDDDDTPSAMTINLNYSLEDDDDDGDTGTAEVNANTDGV